MCQRSEGMLNDIEKELWKDPGHRGILPLCIKGDFHEACNSLANVTQLNDDSKAVAIILGFPLFDTEPIEENDGVAGAIYLAKVLLHLGRRVDFFIDAHSNILKKVLTTDCLTRGFYDGTVSVKNVRKDFSLDNTELMIDSVTKKPMYSHVISIERPCRNKDGRIMSMNARDVTEDCDPTDLFFLQATQTLDVITIGIGDGGNEVGMGKVHDLVVKNITHGKIIAASISCDHLVTCGVSNWGGLGIAAGVYAIHRNRDNDESQRLENYLMSDKMDEDLHRFLCDEGFRDGTTGAKEMIVDGLDYYEVHLQLLRKIREIVTRKS